MNQALLDRIAGSSQLPTLPIIAMKVLELTRRQDVSVPEIASLIMNDVAMTSKILKTVNSPFYGLTKQVSTVSNALVILGLQAAKTLALGFSLLGTLKKTGDKNEAFDHTLFWKRSIYSAAASRVIARSQTIIQQEEAFLAGLLANIGVLVLHRAAPDEFDPIHAQCKGDYRFLNQLCQEKLQLEPAQVSAILAEKWQLPPVLAKPISPQPAGDAIDPQMKPLIDAVASGATVAGVFVAEDSAAAIAQSRTELATRFQLPPDSIESILKETGDAAREAAAMLDMPIGTGKSYQEILDEAQERLINLSLESQHQMQTIKKEVETLQVKATTDPLTGLANRARFDEFFEEHFKRAFTHHRPLSLIFIDVDHFKSINDNHGHLAGDEVLRRVARILRGAMRNIDLAARYGGEEFALVLTEADTTTAAMRADTLRNEIANHVMRYEELRIKVTVSAGVAGTDRTRIFTQTMQLTNAADRAVYAAKGAGRNCVRVFKPAAPKSTAGAAAAGVSA